MSPTGISACSDQRRRSRFDNRQQPSRIDANGDHWNQQRQEHPNLGAAQVLELLPARRQLAEEELLHHAQEQRCSDQNSDDADAGEPGIDGESASEELELGNERSEKNKSEH